MTKQEWLACTDPTPLMQPIRLRANHRKLWLFAVACCRRIWHLFTDQRVRDVVELAESRADGMVDEAWLRKAWQTLSHEHWLRERWREVMGSPQPSLQGYFVVQELVTTTGYPSPYRIVERIQELVLHATNDTGAARRAPGGEEVQAARAAWSAAVRERDSVQQAQSDLIRCIFGNPFHPVSLNPAWQTPTVVALATAAYDEQILPQGHLDPQRLAVLANALEDAGCAEDRILSHLRGPGPHVRGCWLLDLLLSKDR